MAEVHGRTKKLPRWLHPKERIRVLIKEDFQALRRRGIEMESMKMVERARGYSDLGPGNGTPV